MSLARRKLDHIARILGLAAALPGETERAYAARIEQALTEWRTRQSDGEIVSDAALDVLVMPPLSEAEQEQLRAAIEAGPSGMILPVPGPEGYAVADHGRIDVSTVSSTPRAAVVRKLHRGHASMTDAEVWQEWRDHCDANAGLEVVRVAIVNMGAVA